MNILDYIKSEYHFNSIVMSELLRNFTNILSTEEIEYLLIWSGDDEYMKVRPHKEIVVIEEY